MSGNYSNYENKPPNYWGTSQQEQGYSFEIPMSQPELAFQVYDSSSAQNQYSASNPAVYYGNNPYLNPGMPMESENLMSAGGPTGNDGNSGGFEDEPPLLEELGINPEYIMQKTITVLNPFHTPDLEALQDTDLAGPLVFCLAFGSFLLLAGKIHFNYIYGIGVFGCLIIWALLGMMSTRGAPLGTVVTVLGYCILPMIGLAGINVVFSLQGYLGIGLTSLAILWASLSASKLFVTALSMEQQQALVFYPCALLYGVFALIIVF